MPRLPAVLPLVLALALATLPVSASGQARRSPRSAGGWPPIEIGVHGGFDFRGTGSVFGGQMRIPLHRSGFVELVPNGDVSFLREYREYMIGGDLVAVLGGRQGGLYVGGGVTWRDAVYGGERSTQAEPTIVVGVRASQVLGAPFGTQLEVRSIQVSSPIKPKFLTLGINFPLWGWGER